MKKYIALTFLLAAVAFGQSAREVHNRSLDEDTQLCVNDGGTKKCQVAVDGDTGDVSVAPGGEATTIGGNATISGTVTMSGDATASENMTLDKGMLIKGEGLDQGGNPRTGVFSQASINDLAGATTSPDIAVKKGITISAALIIASCHRDSDGSQYTSKAAFWRSRSGPEQNPSSITTSTNNLGAAFTLISNAGGLAVQNDAGVFIDCTLMFIGPGSF
jgi:hypothetical protein